MTGAEAEAAARLLERLVSDPGYREQFRRNPVAASRQAGLASVAEDMAMGGGKALDTLEGRESRSSLAGLFMAAALEGAAVYDFSEEVLPRLDDVPESVGNVLSRVHLPAIAEAQAATPRAQGIERVASEAGFRPDAAAGEFRAITPQQAAAAADHGASGASPGRVDPAEYGQEGSGGRPTAETMALLHNKRVAFDADGIADLKAGRIDPRVASVLTAISRQHRISVSAMVSDHQKQTSGGSISNHFYGRAMDIAAVDGQPVGAGNAAAREVAIALSRLPRSVRPSEIGSPWALPGAAYFTDGAHQNHLHVAFDDPIVSSWTAPEELAASGGSPADADLAPGADDIPEGLGDGADDVDNGGDSGGAEDGGDGGVDDDGDDDADAGAAEPGGLEDPGGDTDAEADAESDGDDGDNDSVSDDPSDEQEDDENDGGEASDSDDEGYDGDHDDSSDGDDDGDGDDGSDGGDGSDSGTGRSDGTAGGPVDLGDIDATYPGDDAPREEVAAWMGGQARKRGLPPELPVMAALVESGMRNLHSGDADSVGFFQMRVGIWNQGDYEGYPDRAELQLKWFLDQALAVKRQRIAAGKPVDDPGGYGEWIADTERPAAQYRGRYQPRLGEARGLLRRGAEGQRGGDGAGDPLQLVEREGGGPGGGPRAVAAVAEARKYLGTPYRWGGSSPKTGFDCSGLVQWAYAKAGIAIPRTSEQQILASNGRPVDRKHLLPGDLVFFRDSSGDVHHVGMSLGGDKFINAPHTGDVVKMASLKEPYYAQQFTGGRRFDLAAGHNVRAATAGAGGKGEGYARGVDPVAVRAAEAALARDAAEVQRPGTLLFEAVRAQELRKANQTQVLRAVRPRSST